MATDPILQFRRLFARAQRSGIPLPEAMALATADRRGRPSVRYVLLKQVDPSGFVFFTDTRSRKGRELDANPYAAAVFYWDPIGKQVRVEGRIEAVSAAEADAYWLSRPRQSRLAARTSRQSAEIASHRDLMERWRALRAELGGTAIERPAYWSGYRIVPDSIEFWTRRAYRLHERVLFERTRGGWRSKILQP